MSIPPSPIDQGLTYNKMIKIRTIQINNNEIAKK